MCELQQKAMCGYSYGVSAHGMINGVCTKVQEEAERAKGVRAVGADPYSGSSKMRSMPHGRAAAKRWLPRVGTPPFVMVPGFARLCLRIYCTTQMPQQFQLRFRWLRDATRVLMLAGCSSHVQHNKVRRWTYLVALQRMLERRAGNLTPLFQNRFFVLSTTLASAWSTSVRFGSSTPSHPVGPLDLI